MNEKRKSPRVDIELPASFEVDDGREDNLAIATTLNISASGVCFNTKQKLTAGQKLFIKVKLPGVGSMRIHVQVVWVKWFDVLVVDEYDVGVRLIDPDQKDERIFFEFCQTVIS